MNSTVELIARKWYKMALAYNAHSLVSPIAPDRGTICQLGAALSAPVARWSAIHEDGHETDLSVFDLGAQRIGGIVGPVDDLPDLDDEGLAALRAKHVQAMHKQKLDDHARALAEENECAALPAMFAHLVPLAKTPGKSSHAAGAANIRRHLAKLFPGVKFSVTSKIFSGGNSIDISWDYGPTSPVVDKACDIFKEGDFDGMDDSYTYRRNQFPRVFGGAKYVMAQRYIPTRNGPDSHWWESSLYGAVGRELCRLQAVPYAGENTPGLYGENDPAGLRQHVNRFIYSVDFPRGFSLAKFAGLDRDGNGGYILKVTP